MTQSQLSFCLSLLNLAPFEVAPQIKAILTAEAEMQASRLAVDRFSSKVPILIKATVERGSLVGRLRSHSR